MANAQNFGECAICRQGSLVAMKEQPTGKLLLICDDCESCWLSPAAAKSYQEALTREPQDLVYATEIEVAAAGWL